MYKLIPLSLLTLSLSLSAATEFMGKYHKNYKSDKEVRAALVAMNKDALQKLDKIPPQTPSKRAELEYLVGIETNIDIINPKKFSCSEKNGTIQKLLFEFDPKRGLEENTPIATRDSIKFIKKACEKIK